MAGTAGQYLSGTKVLAAEKFPSHTIFMGGHDKWYTELAADVRRQIERRCLERGRNFKNLSICICLSSYIFSQVNRSQRSPDLWAAFSWHKSAWDVY